MDMCGTTHNFIFPSQLGHLLFLHIIAVFSKITILCGFFLHTCYDCSFLLLYLARLLTCFHSFTLLRTVPPERLQPKHSFFATRYAWSHYPVAFIPFMDVPPSSYVTDYAALSPSIALTSFLLYPSQLSC